MEFQCVVCGDPTVMHCFSVQCVWEMCLPCGLIYGPQGVIPTWERYTREQRPGANQ